MAAELSERSVPEQYGYIPLHYIEGRGMSPLPSCLLKNEHLLIQFMSV